MKPLINFIILSFIFCLNLSLAREAEFAVSKRYEHDVDEHFDTDQPLESTIILEEVYSSRIASTEKGGTQTSQEAFTEPTDLVSESIDSLPSETPKPTKPTSDSDTKDSPPPLSDANTSSISNPNSTSRKPTGKPKSSSSSSPPLPEEPPTETTVFYKKLVKIHINPTQAPNHPIKPKDYPTFADYEEGIAYVKGIPHQILAADTDYKRLKQAEDGISWEEADKKDEKAKQEELELELEHQNKLVAGEGGRGGAVYSADMTSGEENAVKKAVFFSVIAAGIITIGLLAFFGIF
ncbi:hypothetical protein TWF718_007177 [Orbilia javanica]|uniref:Uncharacterized protein n=1 Tax=Orbilia javanica TaxID=47235 RepID=A0AAN8RD20_9PEZI